MRFPKIDQNSYQELTDQALVLATHRDRPAIMLTPENKIIKHIYKRGLWSSSTMWPYASRFRSNAKKLEKLGIHCPTVEAIYHYPDLMCDLIVYPFINGKSVHQTASQHDFSTLEKTPQFIAKLHNLGIYFHDLHLGNLVYHNNDFSLVDIASVKVYRKPLSRQLRQKNLDHLYNRQEDKAILNNYGWQKFLDQCQKESTTG